jgi:VWFA-related protein
MSEKYVVFSLCITVLLLAVAAAPIAGDDIADFSIEWLDTSSFPANIIYYSTTDAAGEPAGSMWVPDDVRIWEGGAEHRPDDFGDDEHAPAYLSLIIDSSGSMEGSLEEVLEAARTLIEQFDSADRAEIIDFDSGVVTRRSFTDSKEEMRAALTEITVGGGTALYDAVAAGFDHLQYEEGMKAVLVLSDGEDENSTKYSFAALKERLANEGVRVFTIALGKNVDTATMTEIAELTGGSFHQADTADDVGEIYTGIITYLHSLHRMWYSTSQGMFDGSEREITVEYEINGKRHSAFYTAPEAEYWSHALEIERGQSIAPVKISPDGEYVSVIHYKALISEEGRRLTRHRWEELYDGSMTEHFVCGYTHRNYGGLHRYDPETRTYEAVEPNAITDNASGDFHREWEWYPKGISPNEKYLILCADPEEGEYDYYFMLFDREEERALWERGFYKGEFDEPGPACAANDGLTAVVQDDNLFMVEPNGELRFTRMWEDTGRRWQLMDMSANGSLVLGRASTGDRVWLYSTDGSLLWEKPSDCHEKGGYLALSPNGEYAAYADSRGPHVCDAEGNVLFELQDTDFGIKRWRMKNGIDIANDGSFVYTIANRIHYRELGD